MKKIYIQPTMFAVMLQHKSQILSGSITGVDGGDTEIGYGGEGGGDARVRENTSWDWDNDWSE